MHLIAVPPKASFFNTFHDRILQNAQLLAQDWFSLVKVVHCWGKRAVKWLLNRLRFVLLDSMAQLLSICDTNAGQCTIILNAATIKQHCCDKGKPGSTSKESRTQGEISPGPTFEVTAGWLACVRGSSQWK
jgi:hypothetical protein